MSRRKTIDHMIAATTLAHGLSLITLNAADFGMCRVAVEGLVTTS